MLFSPILERSSATILTLFKSCKTIRDLNQVHTHIIRKGCEQDQCLIAQFITICTTLMPTNHTYTSSVFNRIISPDVYLCNIMLKIQCKSSNFAQCFSFLSRMGREFDVVPDKYTFPPLIKVCSKVSALRAGKIVHGLTVRLGTEGDVYVGSSLIDLYGKCGEIECARKVFDEMSVKNEVSWTAMMNGYLSFGDMAAARGLFVEMPKRTEATWNAMIKGLVKFGDLNSARKLFDIMPVRNEVSFTTMIDGYAKGGDMASARSLFDELPEKDLVSWSALLSGYVQNGKPNEAVKAFGEMLATNVKPDEFVLVSLMSACSQLGSLELAKRVESYIANGSFDLTRLHVSAALVDMNAKCGDMKRASYLFEAMPKRDLVSYCSMIQGHSIHGQGLEAVILFDQMIDEGVRPDDVAFTVILTACSHADLVNDGFRFFELMSDKYSISPSPDHYACMVNLLGKSGKVKAAYELISSMPVESHAGAWGALLGACGIHCDVELGEVVARRLFELEPLNGGNYVLLSNIYAEADRWVNVSRLRDGMSERGVKKVPGFSYVESSNTH